MTKPAATIASAYLVTLKAMIWAVMVVPMLAPRIIPIDWESVSSPEVMKPTTSTVVTEDDWITAVTPAPANAAENRLLVSRARKDFMRAPATSFSASVILRIP